MPLMLIEIEQAGERPRCALKQLKSSSGHCRECHYGAVTDGTDIVIVDSEFKPVSDIPHFKNSWLSESMISYEYRKLKTRAGYRLLIDGKDPSSLEVQSAGLHGLR